MKILATCILTLWLLAIASGNAQDQRAQKFKSLSPEDSARLNQQRALVAAAVKRHSGGTLTGSQKDLPLLQKLIDESVFNKAQTYELQSLGVAFGDVLASALALHWVMITDEYGTAPTLRFKHSSANINALTMISKRVEEGGKVNLQDLLANIRESLAQFDKNSR